MINILVFGMTENPGGMESAVMSYYRKLNGSELHFDFLCNEAGPLAYQDEMLAGGSKIFRIPARSRDFRAYQGAMRDFFTQYARNYEAIWVNTCSLANIDYLVQARKYGIERRIIHSHNAMNMDSRLRGVLHGLNKWRVSQYATDFWACSESAARWFYREPALGKAVIIRNAIDVKSYVFSPERRAAIRASLGCGDSCCLVGNVGRLHFQKNQMFALDIFRRFREKCPDSKLVLVGQGPDREKLLARTRALDLEGDVVFAGVQTNVPDWLSAMDLFLFPSTFEGLGIAALEAQASGLPVLASSDVIPTEVGMSAHYQTCSLTASPEAWAEKLDEMRRTLRRKDAAEMQRLLSEKGFEIDAASDMLKALFMEGRQDALEERHGAVSNC